MKYEVIITKYHTYEVEADNEHEAEKIAIEEFESDMRRPIANIHFDELEIEEIEEDEEK